MSFRSIWANKIIHIVGIGGIGMSALAFILKELGYRVQGSDVHQSANTKKLCNHGIEIFIGHNSLNIVNADLIARSTAVTDSNPEIVHALELGKPIISRAELLAFLMRFKQSISVAGCHGKTTTTAFISSILINADLKPTVVNGGIMLDLKCNAKHGDGNWFVAEADESDGTFTKLPTSIAVVTNIDHDHLDFYGCFDNLKDSFRQFLAGIDPLGYAVVCFDDVETRNLTIKTLTLDQYVSYGINYNNVDVCAQNIHFTNGHFVFDVILSESFASKVGFNKIDSCKIMANGMHNVLNALAAIGVACIVGLDVESIKNGLSCFVGVDRRFTTLGSIDGIRFVSDYAHHPTEIAASIAAAKSFTEHSRVLSIVQPHRYSRVSKLFDSFTNVLSTLSDPIVLLDVCANGELLISGGSTEDLYNYLKSNNCNSVYYVSNNDLLAFLKETIQTGDLVLFMGAGDIDKIADRIFKDCSMIDSGIF